MEGGGLRIPWPLLDAVIGHGHRQNFEYQARRRQDGFVIHTFRHVSTGRFLRVSDGGVCWLLEGQDCIPISCQEAVDLVRMPQEWSSVQDGQRPLARLVAEGVCPEGLLSTLEQARRTTGGAVEAHRQQLLRLAEALECEQCHHADAADLAGRQARRARALLNTVYYKP